MVDLLSLLESGRNLTMPQSPFRIAVILGRYSGGCTNFGSVTKGVRFASCICFERNTRFLLCTVLESGLGRFHNERSSRRSGD